MPDQYNIYCDESCHLERELSKTMVLGATWCPTVKARSIAEQIREIKVYHKLSPQFEVKWTKVSPAKEEFYLNLVDYFFNDNNLHFRAVLIPDKSRLDHAAFDQDHDDWYYKMCFTMLDPIIDPNQSHRVYLDIKDTRSEQKRKKLERILRFCKGDYSKSIIKRVQQIRSHESEILQLADLLIGAIGYANRGLNTGSAKVRLVNRIRQRAKISLVSSTSFRESKFNLFRWSGRGGRP